MTTPLPSLIVLFSAISPEQGALRARLLTSLLNEAIAGGATRLSCPEDWEENWQEVIGELAIQPISLSLPWQAYHFAQAGVLQMPHSSPEGVRKILCTVPFEYLCGIPADDPLVKMSSDSVLNCVAALIRSAKKHMYVLAPYWRTTGVEQLRRRVGDISLENLSVTLITAADMSIEDAEGCEYFAQWLTATGASVSHWVPKSLISNGVRPLMHTKAAVVDGQSCYIGSANFSNYGFQNSIEMGAWMDGSAARQAELFIATLLSRCERIDVSAPRKTPDNQREDK